MADITYRQMYSALYSDAEFLDFIMRDGWEHAAIRRGKALNYRIDYARVTLRMKININRALECGKIKKCKVFGSVGG